MCLWERRVPEGLCVEIVSEELLWPCVAMGFHLRQVSVQLCLTQGDCHHCQP